MLIELLYTMKYSKNKLIFTAQFGWDFWIALFPYLLVDPSLELSIKTYLFTLNPVVASPKTFLPNLSLLKDCFAIFAKPLACMLFALTPGTNPP